MKARIIHLSAYVVRVAACFGGLAAVEVSLAQTSYSWLSDGATGGMDTDWSNATNWDAQGVPVDQDASTDGLSGDMVLVFGETALPDEFPDFAGGTPVDELRLGADIGGATQISPVLDVRSGGKLIVKYLGKKGVVRFNADVDPVWTVGDGIGGGTEDVELEIRSNVFLNRYVNGTLTGVVNSDGVLTVGGALKLSYDSKKHSVLEVNGGTVVTGNELKGVAKDTQTTPTESKLVLRDSATVTVGEEMNGFIDVDIGGHGSDVQVDFAGTASLTSPYGGDFPTLAEVNNHIGDVFVSSSGLEVVANDNGDGTFTVSAAESFLAVILRGGSGEMDLTWDSVPGDLYTIEVSENLQGWNPLETGYPAADPGGSTSYPLGMPTLQPKFYRVVLEGP